MKDYSKLQNGSDIRGIALEGVENEHINLTDEAVRDLSLGFAKWLCEKTNKPAGSLKIAVGTDSRISSPAFLEKTCEALASFGVHVLKCGMASTPAMYMSTQFKNTLCDGAVMITASHLPFNRNGFKYFTKESGLEKADIKALIKNAETTDTPKAACGTVEDFDLMSLYCSHIQDIIKDALGGEKPLSDLHIAVDAGNGAGGFFADRILAPLGADISGSQFLEPDGSFPNHQPNPENKAAMDSISKAVLAVKADLGIIFDTDVDRSAAVDEKGREIARNGIVAMAASLIAEDFPGSTVVTDSITSTQLKDYLENRLHMKHLRYKRGYRNVINKG
ncbi:MAG: phosphomannomutase/phosphoglucomutase, partial [Firmicutes bacterium]|nr:phosphomannomutase/phosphoglucomutase [Bacillota bacterium]